MMKLNPPNKKKTMQEVANWNRKATIDKSCEKNNFKCLFKRPLMTFGRLPLNQGFRLQKMTADKRRDHGFRKLTLFPPISHRRLLPGSLALGSLRRHPEGHEPLLTRICSGAEKSKKDRRPSLTQKIEEMARGKSR